MIRFLCFLLCVLLFSPESQAAKKIVAANLTDNFVGVSEGFDGAKLTIFGVLKNKADAIVVIEGPPVEAKIRKKAKTFGLWINGEPTLLPAVPSYYAVTTSRPVEAMMDTQTAQENGFDLEHLPLAGTAEGAGYVEAKREAGLFRYRPGGVQILESNLFRADVLLPPSVPIGTYKAHIYEVVDGKLTATRDESFEVAQVGLTAWISRMAKTQAVGYALLALALSLSIGACSAYLAKRLSR